MFVCVASVFYCGVVFVVLLCCGVVLRCCGVVLWLFLKRVMVGDSMVIVVMVTLGCEVIWGYVL